VIRSVNNQPVADLIEFEKLYNASIERKEPMVLLEIQRGRGRRSAVLRVTHASTNQR
jgi:hypothetical protein